jgi:hypothetical protein
MEPFPFGQVTYFARTERLNRLDIEEALRVHVEGQWGPLNDCEQFAFGSGERVESYHIDRNGIEFTITTLRLDDRNMTMVSLPKKYRWADDEAGL